MENADQRGLGHSPTSVLQRKISRCIYVCTVALDANFDAIQNFAVGKTISELEDVAAKGAEAVDAVSGATLVDTAGYLSAIVDAAKNAQTTQAVEFNGSSEDLKLNVVYGAAHGTKCFTSGAVATAGDTIVLSYIDEFQFAGSDAGVVGVPNSDSDFGAGYAEGKVLMSKRVNADYYSKMMAEKAGSTVSLDANYDAIQNHVNGMSIADAEALSKDEKAVDAVSGATLVDTAGYVGVLVDTYIFFSVNNHKGLVLQKLPRSRFSQIM